ncbi:MAG: IS110 family transposase [Gallionella sp.]|jgi:transposase|nr:IS110 family transposase [Gallionella sp.]MCK9353677.1 IS110 family transposase [Gallionella sp.]
MSEHPTTPIIFGADVGSTEIVIACADSNQAVKTIANNRREIEAWLAHLPGNSIIGMEATGRYHCTLADCAAQRGFRVYVINPKRLSLYAKGVGQRGKTDPLDARVIARYVVREGDRLHPYAIPTAVQRTLRNLLTQRANIVRHCGAIRQCLLATESIDSQTLKRAHKKALQSLQNLIAEIDIQLRKTVKQDAALEQKCMKLQTIIGVGPLNALALTHRFDRTPFANSDAVVAAYGLDPRPKDSGNKVGRRCLTKQGNAEDRRLIYLAAQSAAKTKTFRPMYVALRAKGFATTEAIVVIARKLLCVAFAVWTSNQPFNPEKLGFQACRKP